VRMTGRAHPSALFTPPQRRPLSLTYQPHTSVLSASSARDLRPSSLLRSAPIRSPRCPMGHPNPTGPTDQLHPHHHLLEAPPQSQGSRRAVARSTFQARITAAITVAFPSTHARPGSSAFPFKQPP
jgi:hypothetical protein